MTNVLELDIESIAAGGDGVARHEGLVVFVPRTVPGDRALVRLHQKGRLARGVLVDIKRASADRVSPECPHYEADHCGGCQFQHMSLGAQREVKRRIVGDAFRRIGRRTVDLPDLRGGERAWRYRRKLTLALRRSSGKWIAGLHVLGDPDRVFALDDCRIADERLMAVWREIIAAGEHLPDVDRLRGAVRLAGEDAGYAGLVLEGGREWNGSHEFFVRVPSLSALWWTPEDGARRLLHDRRSVDVQRDPGASFGQVNPEVGAQLETFVFDAVMRQSPRTVVDAYAGAGSLAARVAALGVRVTAIEVDAEASAWSSSRLPAPSRSVRGRVEDVLQSTLPSDVVILNPPRSGVDARVTAALAAPDATRALLYVSCDTATLARDVGRLRGWRVERLTAFDMFPQTAHVETVCELLPEDPS